MSRQQVAENLPTETLTRPSTALTSASDHFTLAIQKSSYKHQYANIYFVRLNKLRPVVQGRAELRWGMLESRPMLKSRVLDVQKGEVCYIIGTVYLDMPLKSNVLEEVARDQSLPAPPRPRKIYSPEDTVNLEDESGRVRIRGAILSEIPLVTGMIVAFLGQENDHGDFEAVDYCFAGVAEQDSLDVDMEVDGEEDRGNWVGFVSGLDVGSQRINDTKYEIRLQLLSEFLLGEVGTSPSQRLGAKISRLFILGNSLTPYDPENDVVENLAALEAIPYAGKPPPKGLPVSTEKHALDILNDYFLELSRSLPVHVLPGPSDPSSIAIPQQPFPKAMFRSVKKSKNFTSHTNPTWIGVDRCNILACSGQILDDMTMYRPDPLDGISASPGVSLRLSLLRTTLQCRHMAPTAPDTLACFPYFGQDPFILTHTPHIYALGNQPEFETECFTEEGVRCRLLCIPSFAAAGELVMVNVRTLATQVIKFDAQGFKKKAM